MRELRILLTPLLALLLLVPSLTSAQRTVPEHTLVKVQVPAGDYHDVLVMAIVQGSIHFAETARLESGDYVFTGPPALYQVRVSTFTKGDLAPRVRVSSVKIGGSGPGPVPPDPPDPGPLPPPDAFDNLGRVVHTKMGLHCSPRFPRARLKAAYLEVAARLAGEQEPIIGTMSQATAALKLHQDEILVGDFKEEWREVSVAINDTYKRQSEWTRQKLANFMKAVAAGISN